MSAPVPYFDLVRHMKNPFDYRLRLFTYARQHSIKAAMQVWQEEDRKLTSRFMLDPTFELQIKAVAKALSLRGILDGDEVRSIMEEALEACSSPDVPAAAPASGHGG
jgi:hypothetical protein